MGLTLGQAALIAGISAFAPLILGGVPFAEFYVLAKLIAPADPAETARNILAHRTLFVAGLFAYLITFIADLVLAWALYVLLAPVNRALSLLTAWFRLIFTAMALFALMHLVSAFRLLDTGAYAKAFGDEMLHAQVDMLIKSFRYEMSLSLVIFGIDLTLLGYLVARSGYIPRLVGILLVIAGLGYLLYYLSPYLYPNVNLRFFVAFSGIGELVFAFWLLLRGWKIPEPPLGEGLGIDGRAGR